VHEPPGDGDDQPDPEPGVEADPESASTLVNDVIARDLELPQPALDLLRTTAEALQPVQHLVESQHQTLRNIVYDLDPG
jgi:hypothetical protein